MGRGHPHSLQPSLGVLELSRRAGDDGGAEPGIAIDRPGAAYVVGGATSMDVRTTRGEFSAGTQVWGGTGDDATGNQVLDGTGNLYVAGCAASRTTQPPRAFDHGGRGRVVQQAAIGASVPPRSMTSRVSGRWFWISG
jgi:hypothetical protein